METEHLGMNRTGIQMSPVKSKEMQELQPETTTLEGESLLAAARNPYIANADQLGSVPLPGSLKGALNMGMTVMKGESPQILIDKLAERLAFERSGTRLYDALITKCEILLDDQISMTVDDLRRIRSDEARHFAMVRDAIEELGGDPTCQTPSADLVGVESMGLVQVLTDPRTTIAQSLHAILAAELVDKAGWETLIALADANKLDKLVLEFSEALEEEREHLALVETWYNEALGLSYGDVERDPN
jgi:rubrerythrin